MNLQALKNDEITPELKILNEINKINNIDLKYLIKTINKKIAYYYDRNHTISHSHFKSLINKNSQEAIIELKEIFIRIIIPMLKKYFFNNWELIREILSDNKKEEKYQFINKYIKNEVSIYEINEKAFLFEQSYIKIYD